ncbi:3015_t:CDS:2 [Paraglomus brasilianum]|uniref:3015_t:CDS:1 n=1 Tax=Paraglomus brasilianum TaxID=144538 RepID=A0A9N9CCW3_9GLOM|nr:3015_t:CDS:2 [Paraglomus brasilianum]
MKINASIVFLLATLSLTAFGTPVTDVSVGRKKDLNKRAPAFTDIKEFAKDTLSGKPSFEICKKSKLTKADGTQNKTPGPKGRTCVEAQLGEVPDITKMTSTIIVQPENGQRIKAKKPFQIKILMSNIDLGNFDNPATQYNIFGQQLNKKGIIKGHSHVTIQDLGNGKKPPNAEKIDFFLGLNGEADKGSLSVTVTEGLSPGLKRLCTMSGSFSHQPLVMPVAQRGAQDDCIRFVVQ